MESSKDIKISMCNLVSFKSLFLNTNAANGTESTRILLIQHHLTLQPHTEGLKTEKSLKHTSVSF